MIHVLTLIGLIAAGRLIGYSSARISDASELTCGFDYPCHWFNGTSGLEDDGDWLLAQAVTAGPVNFMINERSDSCPASEGSSKFTFEANCRVGQPSFFVVSRDESQGRDGYAFAVGGELRTASWLVSAEVPRQVGAGVLRFDLWRSDDATALHVCGRKPPGYPSRLDCSWHRSKTLAGVSAWQRDRAIIPPSDQPFEIVLVALFSKPGSIVAIDNLRYEASVGRSLNARDIFSRLENIGQPDLPRELQFLLAPDAPFNIEPMTIHERRQEPTAKIAATTTTTIATTTSTTTTERPSTTTTERPTTTTPRTAAPTESYTEAELEAALRIGQFSIADTTERTRPTTSSTTEMPFSACVVNCAFDTDFCALRSNGNRWRHGRSRVGNRVTGIRAGADGGRGFAYVRSENVRDEFTLLAPGFTTSSEAVLAFSYHMAGHKGRLRLCDRATGQCSVVARNSRRVISPKMRLWQPVQFALRPGRHELSFVGDELDGVFFIGLDEVRLLDKDSTSLIACEGV